MAYVSIDIDFDDFDLDDILDYVAEVHDKGYNRKLLSEWVESVFEIEEKPNLSVNDRLKMDFIEEHFDKLTIDKLQSLL
jgi:hypothetical protein